MQDETKTGNTRYRFSWLGKLILQVEMQPSHDSDVPKHFRRWKDATVEDIS